MQTKSQACLKCGNQLRQEDGLCPQCLLAAGMAPTGDASKSSLQSVVTITHPIPDTDELNAVFDDLEVLELIGSGGMGAVYKVRQKKLDRVAALKILLAAPGDESDRQDFELRFWQEAKALAKLNHPGIVTIYDFGTAGSYCFIVMEYIDGVSLRETLLDQKLSPEEALLLVPKLCDALQFAHDCGVVHRDIKPENILLTVQGDVKIADFGLAKLNDRNESLTQTRQILGTPKYMAPEQLEGAKHVDHRADIYSLGVVFYELLTGELPLGRFAPPSKKVAVNVSLDEVVLRSLEKEPVQRYQHASEVRNAIDSLSSSTIPSSSELKQNNRIASWIGGIDKAWLLVLQNILVLAYFYCLFKFFAFDYREELGRAQLEFGSPIPWLSISGEQPAQGQFKFQWQTEFLTFTLLWAIGAHLILFACRSINVLRGGSSQLFSPTFSAFAWCAVVVAILSYAKVSVPDLNPSSNLAVAESSASRNQASYLESLRSSATKGDLAESLNALNSGVDVNHKFEGGMTALMYAARNGHAAYCVALLILGANVNEQDERGNTALMHAVASSQNGVFLAIQRFAKDLGDYQSRRAHLYENDELTTEQRAIREQGLKLKIPGVDQQLIGKRDLSTVKVEIALDLANEEGQTLLIQAASKGDSQLVSALAQADVEFVDKRGRNAIWHAVANEQFQFFAEQLNRQPHFHPTHLVSEKTLIQCSEKDPSIFEILRMHREIEILTDVYRLLGEQLDTVKKKMESSDAGLDEYSYRQSVRDLEFAFNEAREEIDTFYSEEELREKASGDE